MFYPVIMSTVLELTQNLIQEGHKDLALKVLHKYDSEMPDIYPFIDLARSKYFLVATAYTLNDVTLGNKYVNSIDDYVADQLDYNYSLMQKDVSSVDQRTVQLGVSLLDALSKATKENHQTAVTAKVDKHLKDYESKFGSVLGKQQ